MDFLDINEQYFSDLDDEGSECSDSDTASMIEECDLSDFESIDEDSEEDNAVANMTNAQHGNRTSQNRPSYPKIKCVRLVTRDFTEKPYAYFGKTRYFAPNKKRIHGQYKPEVTEGIRVYRAVTFEKPFLEYKMHPVTGKFTAFLIASPFWTRYFRHDPAAVEGDDVCKGVVLLVEDMYVGFPCFYSIKVNNDENFGTGSSICKGCASLLDSLRRKAIDNPRMSARDKLLRQTNVKSFMYSIYKRIPVNSSFNIDHATDFILTIALDGMASTGSAPPPVRTESERDVCYDRIRNEKFQCHHCGVDLKFGSLSGFSQFTYDRTVFDHQGKSFPYDSPNQVTVRSCLFCQYWFWNSDAESRKSAIDILIGFYKPQQADIAVFSFVNGFPSTKPPDESAKEHWSFVWERQSKEARDRRKNASQKATYRALNVLKEPKPSNLPDIRDWSRKEMQKHMSFFGNSCVVTGITMEKITLVCDRICDDGRYVESDTVPLCKRLNVAKVALRSVFKSKASFYNYCQEKQLVGDPIQMLVEILREPLERLRNHQIKLRTSS